MVESHLDHISVPDKQSLWLFTADKGLLYLGRRGR